MVLERTSPTLWSGLWRETDCHSPSAPWMISPDPSRPRAQLTISGCAEPEPTDDGEPFPDTINEPAQCRATERRITPDAEPIPSDQVRESATTPAPREQAVDGESAEWSSAPCTAAEGELIGHLGLQYVEGDLIDWEIIWKPTFPSPLSFIPSSSPPSSSVPTFSPEWAPFSQSSRERNSVAESSQEWPLSWLSLIVPLSPPRAALWLWPGSSLAPPAPSPSFLLLGSFLLNYPPGLQSLLPSSHPPLPILFPRHENAPSGRGELCQVYGQSVLCFCSP